MARKVQRSSVLEFFISRVHRFLLRQIVLWHIHGMQTPDRVHGAQRPVIFGSCVLSFLCSSILAFFSSCILRFFSSSVVACSSIRAHKWGAVPIWRAWGAAPGYGGMRCGALHPGYGGMSSGALRPGYGA